MNDFDYISDEELARYVADQGTPPVEDPEPPAGWWPSLTEKQMEAFTDETPNLLIVGSRFSGKGHTAQHIIARHCWDHHNALVLIVVKTKRQALAGGIFHKLVHETLPEFSRNIKGFAFEDPRTTAEKDLVVRVRNRFGTYSMVQLMSLNHDNDLEKKIRGLEISMAYLDELTSFDSITVFEWLSNTLGRRNHIPSEAQRFVATCNPSDPKHWVYNLWYVQKDPAFRVIEIMSWDNPDPKCVEYYKRLKTTLRNNPTQYARDVEGKWVATPSGDALFGRVFVPEFHIKGNRKTREWLHPKPGVRITVGLDLGEVNHGITFLQERISPTKTMWVAFDEISYLRKQVNFRKLTEEMLDRVQFWSDFMETDFLWSWISDKSAFDRFRATNGSFDHLEIQRLSEELRPKFPRVKKAIKLLECPKPQGSVESRTRILQDLLEEERFFVSAKCEKIEEMLTNITGTKENSQVPDTHSPYKHMYDAITYPLFYNNVGGSVVTAATEQRTELKPQAYAVGT